MAKNILLLFLSTVKTTKDGTVSKAVYENLDGAETENTNESAVLYLLKKNIALDQIFILASKKVREETFLTDDARTHLDFFRERVEKFLPGVDCFVFDYDEKISGDKNIQSVAVMAGQIQQYAAQFPDEKIILHVDLTGGMRDTNMLMLDLTRLLEYSGLQIGLLLYSNLICYEKKIGRVDELQNIYDLFQLIAGVEEFVNFGSVTALKNYYADKKLSESLTNLLAAMKNFAEAIKLCHYGQFRDAIINLHDAVRDFAPAQDDTQDILMARLIGRIREDYHNLIVNRDLDDLEVIRWCLNHDYLQQALTLYTERIPEYLGEKKIITQSAEEEEILAELVGKDDMKRNRWFYLFSYFKPRDDVLNKAKKIYNAAIKCAVKKVVKDKTLDFDTWQKELNQNLQPLNLKRGEVSALRSQIDTLAAIFNNPKLLLDLKSTVLDPIREIIVALSAEFETKEKGFERRKILSYFLNNKISDDDIPKYFFINRFMAQMKKYPKAVKIYELLVEKNFSAQIPEDNFLSIVDKYFRVKNERNHSNHALADKGEFDSAKELRDFMSAALDELEANLPAQ